MCGVQEYYKAYLIEDWMNKLQGVFYFWNVSVTVQSRRWVSWTVLNSLERNGDVNVSEMKEPLETDLWGQFILADK